MAMIPWEKEEVILVIPNFYNRILSKIFKRCTVKIITKTAIKQNSIECGTSEEEFEKIWNILKQQNNGVIEVLLKRDEKGKIIQIHNDYLSKLPPKFVL